jgi:hypothetical protein
VKVAELGYERKPRKKAQSLQEMQGELKEVPLGASTHMNKHEILYRPL